MNDKSNLLKEHILSQCVLLPIKSDISEITKWCYENIGQKRLYHPIYEKEIRWLNYFKGDWAFTCYRYNDNDASCFSFWFNLNKDRILFKLRWE